jgi:hypothetical protein
MGFGVACAVVLPSGECGPEEKWSLWGQNATGAARRGQIDVRFGDVDGDGKADACIVSEVGLECGLSSGRAFAKETTWARPAPGDDDWLSTGKGSVVLADVDGDGRADACGRGRTKLMCALSTGASFARAEAWSPEADFASMGRILFGDLNGDGRADVCGVTGGQIRCAMSRGHTFTRASVWLTADGSSSVESARLVRAPSVALADVNGDGRADVCGYDAAGVVCALAP